MAPSARSRKTLRPPVAQPAAQERSSAAGSRSKTVRSSAKKTVDTAGGTANGTAQAAAKGAAKGAAKARPRPELKASIQSPAGPATKAGSKASRPRQRQGSARPAALAEGPTPGSKTAPEAVPETTEGVVVRHSPIHGLGLFATRRIEEGECIGVYAGPRSKRIDTYVLWVQDEDGREYGIDGRNEMRYVNHSADPSACFEGEELLALRPIEPGEEITHHYGEDWEDL